MVPCDFGRNLALNLLIGNYTNLIIQRNILKLFLSWIIYKYDSIVFLYI